MTANEIFTAAVSFLSEKSAESSAREFALHWLNLLLREALPTENSIRRFRGLPRLEAAPLLTGWEQEVPFDEELTRLALPYGLASFCYTDDDNDYRAQDFRARYVQALSEAMKAYEHPITDAYGGDAECQSW